MTRAGRPRIPTKLHLLRGDPGKRYKNRPITEPEPELIVPDAPKNLTAVALEEWQRISDEMGGLGLLTRLDRAVMAGYCQAWADYLEAQQHLDEEPKIYKTETGYPVMTPWKPYRDKALELMHKFGTELGLSAASRSRIHLQKKPKTKSEEKTVASYLK